MKFSDRIKIRMFMETDPDDADLEEAHEEEVGVTLNKGPVLRNALEDDADALEVLRYAALEAEDAACPPPRTQQLRPELELRIVDEDAWKKVCVGTSDAH